jgi:hypothetical protein
MPHRMTILGGSRPKSSRAAMSMKCSIWIPAEGGIASLCTAFPARNIMSTLRIFTASSSCQQANAGRSFVPDPTNARPGSGGLVTRFSRVPGTSGNGRITSDERGNAEVLPHASHAAIAASPERQEQIATGGFYKREAAWSDLMLKDVVIKSTVPNGLLGSAGIVRLPSRQERRREAAKAKRSAPKQCACCAPDPG